MCAYRVGNRRLRDSDPRIGREIRILCKTNWFISDTRGRGRELPEIQVPLNRWFWISFPVMTSVNVNGFTLRLSSWAIVIGNGSVNESYHYEYHLHGVRMIIAMIMNRLMTEMTAEAIPRLFQCFSLSMPSNSSSCSMWVRQMVNSRANFSKFFTFWINCASLPFGTFFSFCSRNDIFCFSPILPLESVLKV